MTSSFKPVTLLIVLVLIVGAMVLVPTPKAHAKNPCIWTGTGVWTDTSHWDCGGIHQLPDKTWSVEIHSGAATVTGTQEVNSLTVDVGATLICNSCTLTVDFAPLTNNGAIINCDGTITAPAALIGNPISNSCPSSGPVGGFMEPVNKVNVLAPYLALLGVIGAIAVIVWKRPDN
jgi:hypothetical protein